MVEAIYIVTLFFKNIRKLHSTDKNKIVNIKDQYGLGIPGES